MLKLNCIHIFSITNLFNYFKWNEIQIRQNIGFYISDYNDFYDHCIKITIRAYICYLRRRDSVKIVDFNADKFILDFIRQNSDNLINITELDINRDQVLAITATKIKILVSGQMLILSEVM